MPKTSAFQSSMPATSESGDDMESALLPYARRRQARGRVLAMTVGEPIPLTPPEHQPAGA
jgi:hypothetical protein